MAGELMTVTNIDNTISDTFVRTVSNGFSSPDIGPAYATSGGSAADFNVAAGVGTMSAGTVNALRNALIDTGVTDHTVLVALSLPINNAVAAPVTQWVLARCASLTSYYAAQLQLSTTGDVILQLAGRISGSLVALSTPVTVGTGHVGGDQWQVTIDVQGTQVRCKAWLPPNPEPDYQITVFDSQLIAGTLCGVQYRLESGNTNTLPVVLSIDNLIVKNPQTWQVNRSINGVVKSHGINESIALRNPLVLTI